MAAIFLGSVGLSAFGLEAPGYRWVEAFTDPHLFENNASIVNAAQTRDGLFVGASRGIYLLDGYHWTLLEIPGVNEVVGICADTDGRLIVGMYEDVGYLQPQSNGSLRFVSFLPQLPPAFRERRGFFNPVPGRDGVYFSSFHVVFRWDRHGQVQAWETTDPFPYLIKIGGDVLISDGQRGLYRVAGTSLQLVNGTEPSPGAEVSQAQKVTAAAPFRGGWLMTTEQDGLRYLDGERLERITLPCSAALHQRSVVTVGLESLGPNGYVAVDSQYHLTFLSPEGEVTGRWSPDSFPGYITRRVFVDAEQNVWVIVRNGMLRLDTDTAIRVLDERARWTPPLYDLLADGDRRFFRTESGTFEWVRGAEGKDGIVRPTDAADILGVFDGDVFHRPSASGEMYCKYRDGTSERLLGTEDWMLRGSRTNPLTFYAGSPPGNLVEFSKQNGRWRAAEPAVSFPLQFTDITEAPQHLWLTVGQGRVARVGRAPLRGEVEIFNDTNGLPARWVRPFVLGDEVLFGTGDGIRRFDEATRTFPHDPRFSAVPASVAQTLQSIAADAHGNVWLGASHGSGILRNENGGYVWDDSTLSGLGAVRIRDMFWDPAGWMWCETTNVLLAITPSGSRPRRSPFGAHLGEVRDLRADRVVLGPFRPESAGLLRLPYQQNALQFEIAAPEFIAPGAVEFQTWLEGAEDAWTTWQKSPIRRFPALAGGRYVFHYRARNSQRQLAEGAPLSFVIHPPWYRTVPAYLAAALLTAGAAWGGLVLYARRLHRRNARLEQLVSERTRDLAKAHRELIDASHVAGMAEVATSVIHNVGNVLNSVNVSATMIDEDLRRTEANALEKLSRLLTDNEHRLVDYFAQDPKAKLLPAFVRAAAQDAVASRNKMREETRQLRQNIEHIKEIVAMQQAHASVVSVTEQLEPAVLMEDALRLNGGDALRPDLRIVRRFETVPPIMGQRGKILQILVNLLRNAVQACDGSGKRNGEIVLHIHPADGQRVRFVVADNGVGIPTENLRRIFNHGFTTRRDGHGFALHSAANAAIAMKGSLVAESDGEGRGARFVLELPSAPSQPLETAAMRDGTGG